MTSIYINSHKIDNTTCTTSNFSSSEIDIPLECIQGKDNIPLLGPDSKISLDTTTDVCNDCTGSCDKKDKCITFKSTLNYKTPSDISSDIVDDHTGYITIHFNLENPVTYIDGHSSVQPYLCVAVHSTYGKSIIFKEQLTKELVSLGKITISLADNFNCYSLKIYINSSYSFIDTSRSPITNIDTFINQPLYYWQYSTDQTWGGQYWGLDTITSNSSQLYINANTNNQQASIKYKGNALYIQQNETSLVNSEDAKTNTFLLNKYWLLVGGQTVNSIELEPTLKLDYFIGQHNDSSKITWGSTNSMFIMGNINITTTSTNNKYNIKLSDVDVSGLDDSFKNNSPYSTCLIIKKTDGTFTTGSKSSEIIELDTQNTTQPVTLTSVLQADISMVWAVPYAFLLITHAFNGKDVSTLLFYLADPTMWKTNDVIYSKYISYNNNYQNILQYHNGFKTWILYERQWDSTGFDILNPIKKDIKLNEILRSNSTTISTTPFTTLGSETITTWTASANAYGKQKDTSLFSIQPITKVNNV